MGASYTWLNEPSVWTGDARHLQLRTELETDFWRETFYGFIRDSGHAYLTPVRGDFTASVTVTGAYEALYDQAGLFLRLDDHRWIKAGIEFTDGLMHFSVVVTRDVSDWSVIPLHGVSPGDEISMRLTRHGNAVRVQFSTGSNTTWQLARLCPFTDADAQIGVMACSPQRAGFTAEFRDLIVGPPVSRQLHAD